MANSYADATFLGAVGIPTYGIPGIWGDPDGMAGVHGLNERVERSMSAATSCTIWSRLTRASLRALSLRDPPKPFALMR